MTVASCCVWSVVLRESLGEVLTGREKERARLRTARMSIFEIEPKPARVMVLAERPPGWICR